MDQSRILVVDDNLHNLKVVEYFLKNRGYSASLATNGNTALELVRKEAFDLILLDVKMPYIDGFELCKSIKAHETLKDIPVIFLTGLTNTDDIVKGFEVGGVDYITIPFIKEELEARIKNQLTLKKLRDLLKDQIKTKDETQKKLLQTLYDAGKLFELQ
ncbi:MAG: response regulator [Marinilabiliaceae bacterium]|nr:response regulator [Marinilabiliaceae bacterium]